MTKLHLLLAATAFIALPLSANAGDMHHKNHDKVMMQTKTTTITTPDYNQDVKLRIKDRDDSAASLITSGDRQYTFQLPSSEQLLINGDVAHLVDARGNKFYAPSSAYYTDTGYTIFVEDGSVYSIEEPAEVAYIEVDANMPDAEVTTYRVK